MENFTQQDRPCSDPYFGHHKRALLTRLFETVKTALTPQDNRPFLQEFNSAHLESYTILRNGVHYETFIANECACRVEIMALKKSYPHDDWSFVPDEITQSGNHAIAAA